MQPTTTVVNLALSACAPRGQYAPALAVLQIAESPATAAAVADATTVSKATVATGSLADARSYALAIESCVNADQGEQALELYHRITVSALIGQVHLAL
jgi:hypothetical protein